MFIGMMKGDEVFQHEKDETHAKCSLAEIRKLFLPKNKDSCDKFVRRNYCTSWKVKKYESWNMEKYKE